MKRLGHITLAILLTISAASYSYGFDFYDDLNFIGFSTDGKYLAFENQGTGSEASDVSEYRTTYYVNTVRNSYAAEPSMLQINNDIPKSSATALENRYKGNVAAKL